MDVSPQSLREIEFREKRRGYDQDEVDEFIERVAAGVEILQERVREATERAVRAEQQAREVFDGDDALRRTLGLAQRTADLAVNEARDHGARIVAAAEDHALAVAEEAREQARRLADEAQSQIWADVGRLEAAREQLRQDVAALAQYLEAERERAESALLDAATTLRQTMPGASPPPALHQLDLSAVRAWGPPAGLPTPAPRDGVGQDGDAAPDPEDSDDDQNNAGVSAVPRPS